MVILGNPDSNELEVVVGVPLAYGKTEVVKTGPFGCQDPEGDTTLVITGNTAGSTGAAG
jgi:hypothetical protein